MADLPGNGKSSFSSGAAARALPVRCGVLPRRAPASRGKRRRRPGPAAARRGPRRRVGHLSALPGFPAPGVAAHPMETDAGREFYPGSFSSSEGVPRAWMAYEHRDSGATGYLIMIKKPPRCTSCHDLHGGLPMTSLLYGPRTAGDSGEWCFSCHAAAALLPADHEARAPGAAGRECVDCHGTVSDGRRAGLYTAAFARSRPLAPRAGGRGAATRRGTGRSGVAGGGPGVGPGPALRPGRRRGRMPPARW